ncbi:hypothetical protein BMAGN_1528 [Bifidobacterium magnum]|uniref:Uncharacterized protein n=1 Tax=Bifidobacterium magnum TaxID=1692 RepID=A0A087B9X1_9BIFI|nr:hypothetical protein BMAGN_1528 [Bifidobacterium magnum]
MPWNITGMVTGKCNDYSASSSRSLVRMRIACSTLRMKIFPSPKLEVLSRSITASTMASTSSSRTTVRTLILGSSATASFSDQKTDQSRGMVDFVFLVQNNVMIP